MVATLLKLSVLSRILSTPWIEEERFDIHKVQRQLNVKGPLRNPARGRIHYQNEILKYGTN